MKQLDDETEADREKKGLMKQIRKEIKKRKKLQNKEKEKKDKKHKKKDKKEKSLMEDTDNKEISYEK